VEGLDFCHGFSLIPPSDACALVRAAAAALIAMQRRGVRVVLRLGPAGQPEFALIRQGGPIPPSPPHHNGLGTGVHVKLCRVWPLFLCSSRKAVTVATLEVAASNRTDLSPPPIPPSRGGRHHGFCRCFPKSSVVANLLPAPLCDAHIQSMNST
jgi:hypothetical protein